MVELFYDGLCAFCIRSLRVLRRFDDTGRLRFLDANEPRNVERLLKVTHCTPNLDHAMYAVDSGTAHEGYHAFRVAISALPRLRWLGKIMAIPPVAFVGTYLYRIIASNRRRLGCRVA